MSDVDNGPQIVQWRGGPTAKASIFVGVPREITIDTELWIVCLHDGVTPGGHQVGALGLTPDHRWVGTALQFQTASGAWGEVVDLGQELTQTQLDAITAEGDTQVARVIAEGDTQVDRITAIGNIPYDIGGILNGKTTDGMFLIGYPVPRTVTFPAGLTGSHLIAGIAATAEAVFSFKKNDVEFGTATFAAAGVVATFLAATETVFTASDILTMVAPATADTTLADLGWAIVGTR